MFLQGLTAAAAVAGPAAAAPAAARSGRVLGANDRINVATIGAGGRGSYVTGEFQKAAATSPNQIVGVCDVYQKRVTANKEKFGCDGTLDYRQILDRSDVDAVIVATPDHWHARIALEAMEKGKDVYLEKPMCHTIDEARQLVEMVKKTGRVLQVGSQTTSGDQWAKARQVIADGMLGRMLMSQGSYHRNSVEGEWNWPIDAEAGPEGKGENYIDWKTFSAPTKEKDRPFNADRFFRFRKYWDYSGGIATDLFFHVAAPMNVCWGEAQFPSKVMGSGGIYEFKDEREVPDTFHLIAEYPKGHSVVLTSCMANSQHIPGLIRGHGATLTMVEHGRFEGFAPYITLKAETRGGKFIVPELEAKFKGETEIKVPVAETNTMQAHVTNFLSCIRSRQKPQLDVETAARAQVLISMAVKSYREAQVQYFEERTWKVAGKPFKS
jgi:predicted dehydrogenase